MFTLRRCKRSPITTKKNISANEPFSLNPNTIRIIDRNLKNTPKFSNANQQDIKSFLFTSKIRCTVQRIYSFKEND